MSEVRRVIRSQYLALNTESTFCYWIRYFIRQQGCRSPEEITKEGVTEFLTWLAVDRQVSPSTQNQAFSVLLFLFRNVLCRDLEGVDAVRAKVTRRLPVVLTPAEIQSVIAQLKEPCRTMIQLAWSAGLPKNEILRLRIKALDFKRRSITVRSGRGGKDRITV